eukprot:scaffold561_cov162-Amphora_coffeaeformis.AAC.13
MTTRTKKIVSLAVVVLPRTRQLHGFPLGWRRMKCTSVAGRTGGEQAGVDVLDEAKDCKVRKLGENDNATIGRLPRDSQLKWIRIKAGLKDVI